MAGTHAITNGGRYQAPPSSMIATHVINGRGKANISRDDFAHLLQESLGTDSEGQPNLGNDVLINLKLIVVISRIGVEPLISASNDDPFRRRIDQGKNLSELKCCLEVIELVLRQTPEIIFKDVEYLEDAQNEASAVYAWLLPTVISTVLHTSDVEVHKRCSELVRLCLEAESHCPHGECSAVATYMKDVVSGTLKLSSEYQLG